FGAKLRIRFFQARKLRSVSAGDGFVRHPHHGGGRGKHFGATEAAALTAWPIGIDGHMTELTSHAIHAVPNTAMQDQSSADADAHNRSSIFQFRGEIGDGGTHLSNHQVAAAPNVRVGSHFVEQLPVLVHCRNAQVGPAEIHANSEFSHSGANLAKSRVPLPRAGWLIVRSFEVRKAEELRN